MSTSVLKALPGKHNSKRHTPSILYMYNGYKQDFSAISVNLGHIIVNIRH